MTGEQTGNVDSGRVAFHHEVQLHEKQTEVDYRAQPYARCGSELVRNAPSEIEPASLPDGL